MPRRAGERRRAPYLLGQQIGVAARVRDQRIHGLVVEAAQCGGQVEGGGRAQVVQMDMAVGPDAFLELDQQVLVAHRLAAALGGDQYDGEVVEPAG